MTRVAWLCFRAVPVSRSRGEAGHSWPAVGLGGSMGRKQYVLSFQLFLEVFFEIIIENTEEIRGTESNAKVLMTWLSSQ